MATRLVSQSCYRLSLVYRSGSAAGDIEKRKMSFKTGREKKIIRIILCLSLSLSFIDFYRRIIAAVLNNCILEKGRESKYEEDNYLIVKLCVYRYHSLLSTSINRLSMLL